MITIKKESYCAKCANNPRVSQTDNTEKMERILCDVFKAVPPSIYWKCNDCEEYLPKGETNGRKG